jgi:hypothetical protein
VTSLQSFCKTKCRIHPFFEVKNRRKYSTSISQNILSKKEVILVKTLVIISGAKVVKLIKLTNKLN